MRTHGVRFGLALFVAIVLAIGIGYAQQRPKPKPTDDDIIIIDPCENCIRNWGCLVCALTQWPCCWWGE